MRRTIGILFGASLSLVLLSLTSYYFGTRYALSHAAQATTPECAMCFGVGDEWKILGGFLLVVGMAFAVAAVMMWAHEKKNGDQTTSIVS